MRRAPSSGLSRSVMHGSAGTHSHPGAPLCSHQPGEERSRLWASPRSSSRRGSALGDAYSGRWCHVARPQAAPSPRASRQKCSCNSAAAAPPRAGCTLGYSQRWEETGTMARLEEKVTLPLLGLNFNYSLSWCKLPVQAGVSTGRGFSPRHVN